jgi:hypothetical protein
MPKASNAFRSFFPCSKQLALVSMVTSLLLCHFCPTAHYMPCLPLLHQLKTVCDVTMVTQQCKQSQTIAEQGWKSCIQLTDLNLNHFKMAEATGWNITASTSLWMASPPPNFMKIYQVVQKMIWETDRQDDDLISLFPFLESRLKSNYWTVQNKHKTAWYTYL